MSEQKLSVSDADHELRALVLERPIRLPWLFGLALAFAFLMLFLLAVTWLFVKGVGIWGIQIPIAWGFAITNFVWWIGIGHAGTFISAVLLLLHQEWRTSINRFAEAMTLFAVACAGLFPILHLGRPWYVYWMMPYPSTMELWPQFRSPLVWDMFAVATYGTVSLLFWYLGLVPDLASFRDRAKHPGVRRVYGVLALGWRGSAEHWDRYQTLYLLMAGLATPLVVSVHSIVGLDFAAAIVPGWHSTIFPPYFVAGAIFSGFAMVLTLAIPLRRFYGLKAYITDRHLDLCARLMLVTGLIVAYGYLMEEFMTWYSGNPSERHLVHARATGWISPFYWTMLTCNVGVPQFLWLNRVRRSASLLFPISLLVNVGMWLERYVIVTGSLGTDHSPSLWRSFHPTIWDYATYAGTLGLFFFLFLLFIRVLPVIPIWEVKEELESRGRE